MDGDFTLLEEEHPHLFVYERALGAEQLLVVCNFGDEATPWTLPAGWENADTLIENLPAQPGTLQPREARILLRRDADARS